MSTMICYKTTHIFEQLFTSTNSLYTYSTKTKFPNKRDNLRSCNIEKLYLFHICVKYERIICYFIIMKTYIQV